MDSKNSSGSKSSVPTKTTSSTVETEGTQESPPDGVSKRIWEKFQTLQKRRQQITKRSTEKRIKILQKEVLENVDAEMNTKEEKDVLRSHQVALPSDRDAIHDDTTASRKRKIESESTSSDSPLDPTSRPSCSSSGIQGRDTTQWLDVRPFLTANDHLTVLEKGRHAPKTKLEEDIDQAVAKGDFDRAENLSDKLSTRNFGKKIADAFDAKKFIEKKKLEEEFRKAKKKKKLHWGFEHKQRWETKGNM